MTAKTTAKTAKTTKTTTKATTPATPIAEPVAPPVVEQVTTGRTPKTINPTQAAALFGTAATVLHSVGWL